MLSKNVKKIISLFVLIAMVMSSFTYAKDNPFAGEVDEPVAEPKVNHSESTIIFESPYHAYNPLNPVPAGVNKEEYDSVDNFNIDLKTLDTRIKYFSPRYTNIKQGALSSYFMAYYIRGGNDDLVYDAKSYTSEILDLSNEFKTAYNTYLRMRSGMSKTDPRYNEIDALVKNYQNMYLTTKATYNATNKTINATKTALGLGRALYNIGNVDNNTQISFARRAITKSLTMAVLSYLQLQTYVYILEKQTNLYYDIYKLNEKNFELGLATSLEVSESLSTYENTKNTMRTTKTTMTNVKEQIASNLGYKLSDINKLNFIEPEVDMTYIASINLEEDKKRAYTSNSSYQSITLSDKDKKFPQSTGEELLHKRLNYVSDKISTELETYYEKLSAALMSYEASTYLNQVCSMSEAANLRKLQNELVTELEYKGLELQNLSNMLQVKIAKYNLINATNDYYYGTYGHIDIS